MKNVVVFREPKFKPMPGELTPAVINGATLPVISRSEAQAAGLKRYFTGLACPRGHVVERAVSNHGCVECAVGPDTAVESCK